MKTEVAVPFFPRIFSGESKRALAMKGNERAGNNVVQKA
jgi:hypothetical protein